MIWAKLRQTCCDEGELVGVNLSRGKTFRYKKNTCRCLLFGLVEIPYAVKA